jgi:hypothetical protein
LNKTLALIILLFLCLSSGAWATDYTADVNCSGAWKFEESSSPAIDSSANHNNATGVGTIQYQVTGQFSYAVNQTGAGARFDAGSPATLDNAFDTGGTAVIWINATSWGADTRSVIMSKGTRWGDYGWSIQSTNWYDDRDGLRFLSGFNTSSGRWETGSGTLALGWYHLAVVYNASATTNDPIMYINGVSKTITIKTAPVGTYVSDSATNLSMLSHYDGDYDQELGTKLDESALFNRMLIITEINDIMDNGLVGSGAPPAVTTRSRVILF